jgi:hypothetical protein
MGLMKVLPVFLLACFWTSSVNADWCSDEIEKMDWLESGNAKHDARAALDSQNSMYMAVFGFTITIPGITEAESQKIIAEKSYIVIEGTGDAFCSEEHARLNHRATEYATVYNQTIRAGL